MSFWKDLWDDVRHDMEESAKGAVKRRIVERLFRVNVGGKQKSVDQDVYKELERRKGQISDLKAAIKKKDEDLFYSHRASQALALELADNGIDPQQVLAEAGVLPFLEG